MRVLVLMSLAVSLVACSDNGAGTTTPERSTPVTAVEVRIRAVDITERTVGRIDAATAPTIAAEIPGRIVEVLKDAGDTVQKGDLLARVDETNFRNAVQRVTALHEQQSRTVTRFRNLVAKDSASQSLLDEAEAQLASLGAQLRDAQTALARTRVVAPVDGAIQRRFVSVGDFRGVGDPLFQVSAAARLRISLPFPERIADRLAVGQAVVLEPPAGGSAVNSTITELRPMVGAQSRSVEAIVELDNPGAWRPGSSVSATVVLATVPGQAVVPAQSVVQRPMGSVVYVVEGERVRQQPVRIGVRMNGEVSVEDGLRAGDRVIVDGAGFLTDGARVSVRGKD